MTRDALRVAMVTEVFHDADGPGRLTARLKQARTEGADVAVLPELPLNRWAPTSRTPSDADAELPGGERQQAMARASHEAGIALVGGVILRDPKTGRRHNVALLYDASGEVIARYGKLHLPREEGFWETDHYEPADELPVPIDLDGFPVGLQICSDVNRPEPSHILGAMGAAAVLSPRATPPLSYPRWRIVLQANAVTSCLYVVSVNRPPEPGSPVGGPSIAISPDGEVMIETGEPLAVVTLERAVIEAARPVYPGYLEVRGGLYAEGWARVAATQALQASAIDTNPLHG